ncbi:MAG TPA: hypothetical protein V6D08_07770 [Candidatus Obscuribacterales bacterium]
MTVRASMIRVTATVVTLLLVAVLLLLFCPEPPWLDIYAREALGIYRSRVNNNIRQYITTPVQEIVIRLAPIPVPSFDREKWLDASKENHWDLRLPMCHRLIESGCLLNRTQWEVRTLLGIPDGDRGGASRTEMAQVDYLPDGMTIDGRSVEKAWVYRAESGSWQGPPILGILKRRDLMLFFHKDRVVLVRLTDMPQPSPTILY